MLSADELRAGLALRWSDVVRAVLVLEDELVGGTPLCVVPKAPTGLPEGVDDDNLPYLTMGPYRLYLITEEEEREHVFGLADAELPLPSRNGLMPIVVLTVLPMEEG